jgi:UDP-N-acetylmuramoyl-L-alanyl-D-glutamate--2,6-diaminopimelate ligase
VKTLSHISEGLQGVQYFGSNQKAINKLTFDSREAAPQTVFFAVKGTQVDGHQFISEVIAKGCEAVVCEVLPQDLNESVCYLKVENTSSAMAFMAAKFYDEPSKSLQLVGITGTNGKICYLTYLDRLDTRLDCCLPFKTKLMIPSFLLHIPRQMLLR